jgi:hypothetical protein
MKDRFDLEQEIMGCWGITDDLQHLLEHIDKGAFESISPSDTDELANLVMGLKHIYDMKFQTMFDTFGQLIPTIDLTSQVPNEPTRSYGVRLNDVTPKEWDQVSKRVRGDIA